jgi:hypothetical protein
MKEFEQRIITALLMRAVRRSASTAPVSTGMAYHSTEERCSSISVIPHKPRMRIPMHPSAEPLRSAQSRTCTGFFISLQDITRAIYALSIHPRYLFHSHKRRFDGSETYV